MTDETNGGSPSVGDPTLLAAAELEQRKSEVRRRLSLLEDQRRALVEVRDFLVEEAEGLADRLREAHAERDQLDARTQSLIERHTRIDGELDELKHEITLLEHRTAELGAADRKLGREIATVQGALRASKNRVFSATAELELGRATLSRMDQKLALNKAKE